MYLVINKCVTAVKASNFSCHYLRNRSTLDIGVLGYIGIRNTLPKFCPFLLRHSVYIYVYIYIISLGIKFCKCSCKWFLSNRYKLHVKKIEMPSDNHSYGEKAVSIRYSVCVSVTLGIQHATGVVYIMLSSTASHALLYFSTLSHKRYVFRGGGNFTEHKMCVSTSSTTFV